MYYTTNGESSEKQMENQTNTSEFRGVYSPKGPMTQIIGFWVPNTINNIVFGP